MRCLHNAVVWRGLLNLGAMCFLKRVQDVKACEGTAGESADNAAGSPQGVASVLEASRVLRLHKKIHSLSMKGDFFSC